MNFKATFSHKDLVKNRNEKKNMIEKSKDTADIKEILQKYESNFNSIISYLYSSDEQTVVKGTRFLFNYLSLASDDELALNVLNLNVLDQLFTLFVSLKTPEITGEALSLLSTLTYWVDITVDESKLGLIADTCVGLFRCGKPDLFEGLITFIGNFCFVNDGFSHEFMERSGLLDSDEMLLTIGLNDINYIMELISWMGLRIVSHPFDLKELYQVYIFVEKTFANRSAKCIVYSFKIIQVLLNNHVDFKFSDSLINYFILSTTSTSNVINELMNTLLCFPNQDLYPKIITEDFINNLSLQILRIQGKDTQRNNKSDLIGKYTFHFLNEIFPYYIPKIDNLILVAAIVCISDGSFDERMEALKYIYKLCKNDQEFTIEISAAGLLIPIACIIDSEISESSMICLNILLMLGKICEKKAIDLTQCQGYELIAKVLDKLLGIPESDDMNEKIYELLNYYYIE